MIGFEMNANRDHSYHGNGPTKTAGTNNNQDATEVIIRELTYSFIKFCDENKNVFVFVSGMVVYKLLSRR